jgi:SagB-type dehydrogenase family enzyme
LSASVVLSWREGVSASAADGAVVVQGPGGRVCLRQVPPAALDALGRLEPPGEEEGRLADVAGADGGDALARWFYYLERLTRRGLVCRAAHAGGARLATLATVAPGFVSRPAEIVGDRRYVLSRFAYLRREGAAAVLESPLAHARVVLDDGRAAALVAGLASPGTAEELAGRVGGLPPDAAAAVLALLLRAGMAGEEGAEEEDPGLRTWEFHDLLFHARSRRGRSDAGYGATYRLVGRVPPPPALKPAEAGDVHDLYRPDLERLERDDPPLAWVQERRQSIRDFDAARPITARQLGEFLFRVARVRDYRQVEVPTQRGPVAMDFTSRPYPAGGSLYELEVYVVVGACAGLGPGLYHYDPAGHRLVRRRELTPEVAALLRDAAESTGAAADGLQVLLVLAARFARVAWKYESIAYALTLKHVGVVYQTMYLAATAMGLGACAIGGGDADLFARAAGTDYSAETSVGEFLLGSVAPGPSGPGEPAAAPPPAGREGGLPQQRR